MSDWYKMNPLDWNEGTDDLTLEQEAAYLRICHAIYISERPVRDNPFVVAGLLRCNERRARRLVGELVEAGKLAIEDGHIVNRRAVEEVSNRVRIRMERKSAGSRGGIESAKARANSLKANEPTQAIGSAHVEPEEIREEEKREPPNPLMPERRRASPVVILQSELDAMTAQSLARHFEDKHKPLSEPQAEMLAATLREVRALGGNPAEAAKLAIRKGWVSLEIDYLRNAGFPFKVAPQPQSEPWADRLRVFREDGTWGQAWGPKPGEVGCRVPAELLSEAA